MPALSVWVVQGGDFATCIENIDIGGPSMLRSSAKNHKYVVITTSPAQYKVRPLPPLLSWRPGYVEVAAARTRALTDRRLAMSAGPGQELMDELNANNGQTTLALRRRFAARAFATSAAYDSAIASWINGQLGADAPVVRASSSCHDTPLPHQLPGGRS